MGMFDSMYDADNNEWQTKAFSRLLESWRIGDELPQVEQPDYQVEVLGSRGYMDREFIESHATVRGSILTSINDQRDESLPLLSYGGCWVINNEKGDWSWTSLSR